MSNRDFLFVLVLGGGNALGAYQAGAYEALHRRGLEPDWIVGASAGSVNGALIAGNRPADRIGRLRTLWNPGAPVIHPFGSPGTFDQARRTAAAVSVFAGGQPGLFATRHLLGPWWNPFGSDEPASLYDTRPMAATLARLVDFERLNAGPTRFSLTAVDVETGEDVIFDNRRQAIGPDHVRASSALLPAFQPIEIGGRLLADAGLSANLPLDAALGERFDRRVVCIALDLVPLRAARPVTLGDTISRAQDLMFATQSRRAIAAWQAIYDARGSRGDAPPIDLLHIAYREHDREVSGKAFDFSPRSIAERWASGDRDLSAALAYLDSERAAAGASGLSVHAPNAGGTFERIEASMVPRPA